MSPVHGAPGHQGRQVTPMSRLPLSRQRLGSHVEPLKKRMADVQKLAAAQTGAC